MRELYTFPPNYKQINARFNVRGKKVIFAYGDTIFNPSRVVIPPALRIHEEVHGERQPNPAQWWETYLRDAQFRFDEELPAHRAEYKYCIDKLGQQRWLDAIARRLSGPLYQFNLTYDEAIRLLTQ